MGSTSKLKLPDITFKIDVVDGRKNNKFTFHSIQLILFWGNESKFPLSKTYYLIYVNKYLTIAG
jgi:hypothetical protein